MKELLLVNTALLGMLCFVWKKSDPLNILIKATLLVVTLFNLMALLGKL